jgi:hypothetical protein
MNDTMSLCLATGILAVGGLGLFMYKNTNEVSFADDVFEQDYDTKKTSKRRVKDEEDDDYDYNDYNDYKNEKEEDSDWFGLRSFFGNGDETDEKEKEKEMDKDEDYVFEMFEETKPKKRNAKTKSSRKSGSTRRRY